MDEIAFDSARMYLQNLFAKAGKRDGNYRGNDVEKLNYLCERGAQTFKRKALGLCGRSSVKSLDHIAQIFVDIGIAETIDEGKETIPMIIEALANSNFYAINRGGTRYITFEETDRKDMVKIIASTIKFE